MGNEYYLRRNPFTSDPDDCSAVVVTRGTAGPADLTQMMIQQGSTLTPEDISAAFESMSRAVVALLNQGFRVVTPVAVLKPSIKGTFENEDDAYDPQRHTARLGASSYRPLEKQWRDTVAFNKTDGGGRVAPVPETYHDVASGTSNAALTPNSVGRVTGRNLKLDPADPQQGVFFIGADGAETRAPMYVTSKPGEVIFTTPALEAGDYDLRVCAQVPGSKDKVRCDELELALTVV